MSDYSAGSLAGARMMLEQFAAAIERAHLYQQMGDDDVLDHLRGEVDAWRRAIDRATGPGDIGVTCDE